MNSFFSDIVNEYELDKCSSIYEVARLPQTSVAPQTHIALYAFGAPDPFLLFCNRTIKERN